MTEAWLATQVLVRMTARPMAQNHPSPPISTDLKTKNAKHSPFSRSGAFPDQHLDHLQVAPLCCNHERCIALVFLAFDWVRAQSGPTLPALPASPNRVKSGTAVVLEVDIRSCNKVVRTVRSN